MVMSEKKKSKLQGWVAATTCHGVPDLFNSRSTITILFWFILLTSCLGLALWQIEELLVHFFSKPHYVTNTYLEEAEFVVFPNVTVCNFNRAHRQRVIDAGMVNESGALDPDLLNYLYLSFSADYPLAAFEAEFFRNLTYGYHMLERMRAKYRMWQRRTNRSDMDPYEMVKLLGYRCSDMFHLCQWKGHAFNCCSQAQPVVTTYGLCYSITPPIDEGDTVAKQKIPGYESGLVFDVRVNLSSYTMEVVKYNFLEAGAVLNINYNPNEMTIRNPIGIKLNNKAFVALKGRKQFTTEPKLQIFQRECYDDLQLDILKGIYTRSTCMSDCQQKASLAMCGCVAVSEVKIPAMKFCDGYQHLGCFIAKMVQGSDRDSMEKLQKCLKLCERVPCRETLDVDASVSTVTRVPEGREPFFAERIRDIIGGETDDETAVKGTISISVFFSEISTLVMERNEKIPVFKLISNVGGQLGLWLGISILTIIQAFYYLCSGIFRQSIADHPKKISHSDGFDAV